MSQKRTVRVGGDISAGSPLNVNAGSLELGGALNGRIVNFKGNSRQVGHFINMKSSAAVPQALRGELIIAE